MSEECPLCAQSAKGPFHAVSTQGRLKEFPEINYFECDVCNFIFADPELLRWVDGGGALRTYDSSYWTSELEPARQRSFGPGLARFAEAVLYARVPIRHFVDIGTGPGYLLDALSIQLPSAMDRIYGVEKFPPPPDMRTRQPNYFVGSLKEMRRKFQAGTCIEVIEHLTPKMLRSLAADLAEVSDPQALYIFNTALTDYVHNDLSYLDPIERGHITCWSVEAARKIFQPYGFRIFGIKGKTWAFVAEYRSQAAADDDLISRIWTPVEENKKMLHDPHSGSVLYVLGLDTARAYT